MIQQILHKFFPEIPNNETNIENLFSKKRILSFLLSTFQLILLLIIVRKLQIENQSGISQIFYFILASFTIISFIPLKYRAFIFFTTTIAIIYFAFGLYSGSILVFLGLILVLTCHLPIKFSYRIVLITLSFCVLALLRADFIYRPRIALIVPFLASMFMFRIILYMYELKYNTTKSTLWQKLSYFFMFPNICFLFFPIIDYKTYTKTYYNIPSEQLWQKGIRWMLRGVIHYIAYRFIYHYVCLPIDNVHNLPQLLQYLLSSYALVLRISGLFHFIIGLLCMYGFNLHAPFDNYFLATGFVDLWRRINVYWREFMIKIFFYPVVMKLKKATKYAIPISTLLVFVITCFLHNYQLFWIRGNFSIIASDVIFWLIIGSFITISVIIDEKNINVPKRKINNYLLYFYNTLKIVGMVIFMSIMWSFWTSNSISEWFFIMKKTSVSSSQLTFLIACLVLIIGLGFLIHILINRKNVQNLIDIPPQKTLFLTLPSILILLLFLIKNTERLFPEKIQAVIKTISSDKYNEEDKRKVDAGYYTQVMDGDKEATSTNAWEVTLLHYRKHTNVDNIFLRKHGIITRELKPNAKEIKDNALIETNSFGMRDKEYLLNKPFNTYRMALLGGSYEMGSGVNNQNIFENLTEQKLNENNTNAQIKNYEILNFAMNQYHLLQQVEWCNSGRVFKYNPNAVLYFAHNDEGRRCRKDFFILIETGVNLKYPFLEEIKKQSGVKQYMSETEIMEKLIPFQYPLIMWSYRQMAEACKKNNAKPVWIFLPCIEEVINPKEYIVLQRIASNLGFTTIDLNGVYGNYTLKDIKVSKTNSHPSVLGHKLIAQKLYEGLIKNKKQIFGINQ